MIFKLSNLNSNLALTLGILTQLWTTRSSWDVGGSHSVCLEKLKKMNINEAQSKLHSIGPKLKSNLVTDFDETNG